MTVNQIKLDAYRQSNLAAARIVLNDVARYGGEEALLVRWVRAALDPEHNSIVERLKARADLAEPEEAA